MLINIESSKIIPGGSASCIIHNPDNSVILFTNVAKGFKKYNAHVPLGTWSVVEFENEDILIPDNDVTSIRHCSIIDTLNLVVWKDGDSHRILAFPDDGPLYDPTAVHRLYWAVDTEKLYMNISDTWQMIGTLRHDLLNDIGTYSHNDIDNKLDYLEGKISSVEGGTFDIVEW